MTSGSRSDRTQPRQEAHGLVRSELDRTSTSLQAATEKETSAEPVARGTLKGPLPRDRWKREVGQTHGRVADISTVRLGRGIEGGDGAERMS
jgi:hypothetical protein